MLLVKTEVKLSPIHGLGLFTVGLIPKGAKVWIYIPGFDFRFKESDLQLVPEASREQVLKYSYRDPGTNYYTLCGDDARFFNHSANPNTETSQDGTTASRDIQVGEELTCDYREFDADSASGVGFHF